MLFDLFRKKLKPQASFTLCSLCQNSDAEVKEPPFEEVTQLTGKYDDEHVSLAKCSHCGNLALYYWTYVYDDLWQYWCLISSEEKAHLLEEDDENDPQRPARARNILKAHAFLVRNPVRGLEWAPPGCSVVQGPPW